MFMKRKLLFFMFLLISSISILSIILSSNSLAVGIMSPNDKLIVFQPGLEKKFSFNLVNANKIHSYVAGDLANYTTLVDANQDSGPRQIEADVKLPQYLAPGRYSIFVGGREVNEGIGQIGAVAAIQTKLTVLVLYPGVYLNYNLDAPNLNVNESENLSINIINLGTEQAENVYGYVMVYDSENNTVANITTNTNSIASNTQGSVSALLDSSMYNMQPGIYRAVGYLIYNGTLLGHTTEEYFSVGSLHVDIVSETEQVFVNSTNKYTVSIESDWVGTIKDVYAVISMPNHKTLKTPNADLSRQANTNTRASEKLETYWETTGLDIGSYPVGIDVHYQGITTHVDTNINIVSGKPPQTEKPSQFQILGFESNNVIIMNISIPLVIFLMIILSIIVIVNIYYFVIKRNKTITNNHNNSQKQGQTIQEKDTNNLNGINNVNTPNNDASKGVNNNVNNSVKNNSNNNANNNSNNNSNNMWPPGR